MPEGYHHLTYEDRCQIYALTQSSLSQAAIARQLGVDRSTIKRELDRNTGAKSYRFKQAQEKASQRRRTASCAPRKMKPDLVTLIDEKLTQEQWDFRGCAHKFVESFRKGTRRLRVTLPPGLACANNNLAPNSKTRVQSHT